MITKEKIESALKDGQTLDNLLELIDQVKTELDEKAKKQKEIERKNKAFPFLVKAIYDYIGEDHDFWDFAEPEDVAKTVVKVLEDTVNGEHSCTCGGNCTCKEEDKPKTTSTVQVITPTGNGKTIKKIYTDEEAEEIINKFLESFVF